MSPTTRHSNDPSLVSILLMAFIITPAFLVKSYVIDVNAMTDISQKSVNSPLASKVIFQSPSIENTFKEFLVSSKPLNLRKYSNRPKTKKTKKDSQIYYIPIPPLPYRYIPGIGYNYQPTKIKPLLVEPSMIDVPAKKEYPMYSAHRKPSSPYNPYQQQMQNTYYQTSDGNKDTPKRVFNTKPPVAESKVYRLDQNDYYFNGRPFRLQAAHTSPKYNLTPQNLKSSLYFNKNIIY